MYKWAKVNNVCSCITKAPRISELYLHCILFIFLTLTLCSLCQLKHIASL
nr:MAG TPA_asm: hypothetical protein [Caudoviricetes sp.]